MQQGRHRAGLGSASRAGRVAVVAALCVTAVACVTPAEFRKLERRVIDLQRSGGADSSERARLAELGEQVATLRRDIDALQGNLEVLDHRVDSALEEARAARAEANQPAGGDGSEAGSSGEGQPEAAVSEEVQRYRDAYAQWRKGDSQACVDQFTKFLQSYPASDYADDATYWLADCYFKQGNYSAAVLRFDDVARQYPGGNKAADALYRQGEALLRMGHGKAAGNAFEKVLRDYPDSARAPEAKRQLELLRAG